MRLSASSPNWGCRFDGRENSIGHALLTSGVLLFAAACPSHALPAYGGSEVLNRPRKDAAPRPRDVRVLVASDVPRVRLRAEEEMSLVDNQGRSLSTLDPHEWIVGTPSPSGGLHLGEFSWAASSIKARAIRNGPITFSVNHDGEWSPGDRYPGELGVTVSETGRLDVVNTVDIETYVACVVASEVWPTFETEVYRAQAIAARTYVLYQMTRRSDAAFDVAATQSSQVYRGIRAGGPGRRAAEATRYSRGIVCTWRDRGEDRVFTTYYSAACGGMSQSAAIFGAENDIEPLAGGVACEYCKDAPGDTYRWGPVPFSLNEVRSRLVARYPELASLGAIEGIEVIERTAHGRPLTLRISGTTGESHDLLAERLRLAVGGDVIRSTDCTIRVTRRSVIFEDGRGYGHGLGLCQWGMQGQALLGKQAGEILRYYYPGSKLTRAY